MTTIQERIETLSRPYSKHVAARLDRRDKAKYKSVSYGPWYALSGKPKVWIENASDGLRVTAAHDVDGARIRHKGWFVNDYQDGTAHGVVVQLPAKGGAIGAYAGVSDPYNDDCCTVDFSYHYGDLVDCARRADRMAERYAEEEREYQAKENARMRVEDITADIKREYASFKALAMELRAGCDKLADMPVLRGKLRGMLAKMRSEVRRLRAERARLVEQFGL